MARSTARWGAAACVALTVLASAACKTKDKDPDPALDDPAGLAEDGSDSNGAESDAELITSTLVAGTVTDGKLGLASVTDLTTDGLSARDLGDGAKAVYFPRGCLTVTHDATAQTVTYGFAGCSGPHGLFRITGEVKATYRATPGRLVLNLVGTDLTVNRAQIDWSATAEITATGAAREMRWKGQLAGTTPRGRTFSRTNDKVVVWRFGERCFALSGTSSGTVRDREIRTEIFDFERCQLSCPEAGGRIVITDVKRSKTVEIAFDGSSRATYTGPNGNSSKFPLACQE